MQCDSNENPAGFFPLKVEELVLKCISKCRVKNSQDNLEEQQSRRTHSIRFLDFDNKVTVMRTGWSRHNDR